MRIFVTFLLCIFISACESSCSPDDVDNTGGVDIPDTISGIHNQSALLYWSIYEYCYTQNQRGVADADMDFLRG